MAKFCRQVFNFRLLSFFFVFLASTSCLVNASDGGDASKAAAGVAVRQRFLGMFRPSRASPASGREQRQNPGLGGFPEQKLACALFWAIQVGDLCEFESLGAIQHMIDIAEKYHVDVSKPIRDEDVDMIPFIGVKEVSELLCVTATQTHTNCLGEECACDPTSGAPPHGPCPGPPPESNITLAECDQKAIESIRPTTTTENVDELGPNIPNGADAAIFTTYYYAGASAFILFSTVVVAILNILAALTSAATA